MQVDGAATVATDFEAALPEGWVEQKTEDGKTYYYNRDFEMTQWSRPTPATVAVARAMV